MANIRFPHVTIQLNLDNAPEKIRSSPAGRLYIALQVLDAVRETLPPSAEEDSALAEAAEADGMSAEEREFALGYSKYMSIRAAAHTVAAEVDRIFADALTERNAPEDMREKYVRATAEMTGVLNEQLTAAHRELIGKTTN